jgi:hypothetical protein
MPAFALRRLGDMWRTYVPMLGLLWRVDRLRRRIQREPDGARYTDLAIAPAGAAAADDLELFRQTDAARAAAAWARGKRVSVAG